MGNARAGFVGYGNVVRAMTVGANGRVPVAFFQSLGVDAVESLFVFWLVAVGANGVFVQAIFAGAADLDRWVGEDVTFMAVCTGQWLPGIVCAVNGMGQFVGRDGYGHHIAVGEGDAEGIFLVAGEAVGVVRLATVEQAIGHQFGQQAFVGGAFFGQGVAGGAAFHFLPLIPRFDRPHVVSAVTVGADDGEIGFGAGVAGEVGILVAAFTGGGRAKLVSAQVWFVYRGMGELVMAWVVAGGAR